MPAIAYPPTLPAPSLWGGQPFDRVARSPLPGNTQLRGRSCDELHDIDAAWVYTAAEMAAWVAWYDDTLLYGMRWFAMAAPGAGGWVSRVLKFRTGTVRREQLGNGHFRISAKLQQRGISATPRTTDYLFLDLFNGPAATLLAEHSPDIAPAGASAYAELLNAVSLDGAGQARSSVGGDSRARIELIAPVLLVRPFSIEMTATPFAAVVPEAALFRITAPSTAYFGLQIRSASAESFFATFESTGGNGDYAITLAAHTIRAVINVDDTVTILIDGVAQGTVAFVPPDSFDQIDVWTSAESGGTTLIDRVAVESLVAD